MAHHKEYYTFKWAAAANEEWLTPLENCHAWFTGWRPSAAFHLVEAILASLSEEQLHKIEGLQAKIKAGEERVEKEMVRYNMYMRSWKMLQLVRLESEANTTVLRQVKAARKGMVGGSEKVVKMADCLRRQTLKGVLDVLTPIQRVDFLAATSMLQIQIRKWGKRELQLK
ncbi:transcription factor tga2 [Phtheirospermum japonicum]|uniref:Transcription factor tga2 n=1 Tax=Phtheirospermum japonicum TaxID=374723 RepID=A0A830CM63_9LAMI|nr:transcription factor tga2 [Phtheirospermum japonicum]